MHNKPKVTVITVSYNCKDVIDVTIKSVLNQTYSNIEYVIIDGQSTDGTASLIEQYKDKIDYFISEKDRGIYDAMNKGITAATGDWVIFMNAGDFFSDNEVISKLFSEKIEKDTIVVYGDIIRQCNDYYYYDIPAGVKNTAYKMPVFHQAAFVQLDYHKKHLFDISFKSSGDYNFFYKCHFEDKCKFQYFPITISCFDNTGGMSKDNHKLSLRENLKIWGKEHNVLFRIKLEYHLLIYSIVIWIKKRLLNPQWCQANEKKNLSRKGKCIVNGYYLERQ